jgi:hypothetical protein
MSMSKILSENLRGFSTEQQKILLNGEILNTFSGCSDGCSAECGCVSATTTQYRLCQECGEVEETHTGHTLGCFWTPWVGCKCEE